MKLRSWLKDLGKVVDKSGDLLGVCRPPVVVLNALFAVLLCQTEVFAQPEIADGHCAMKGQDCLFQGLFSTACAGVNGFLGQINIASVTNLQQTPLGVIVEYRDSSGKLQGSVQTSIDTSRRFDFIINDMGLKPNTYGSVCIKTAAPSPGAWTGGVAIYKSDTRNGIPAFGDKFDYVLYYPFLNPKTSTTTFPLNTYHLGTDPTAVVANWIAISDAIPGDGQGVIGKLSYFNDAGVVTGSDTVNIPDGGRFDFSGHEGVGGLTNKDAVGLAQFVPSGTSPQYYMTVTRYFYDCLGASCTNFLTAFAIPDRPATADAVIGGVSTTDAEISVVELNNVSINSASVEVKINAQDGTAIGSPQVSIPKMGTQHVILNKVGSTGFLADELRASATVTARTGFISALSLFYKLDAKGKLVYGYAAPLSGSPGEVQLSLFNTFINQKNNLEIYNLSNNAIQGSVDFIDFTGKNVFSTPITVPSHSTYYLSDSATRLTVPRDIYGTIIVQAGSPGLASRNFVSRANEYKAVFPSSSSVAGTLSLSVAGVTRTSATLRWTNPLDPKLVKSYQLMRRTNGEASTEVTFNLIPGKDPIDGNSYTDTNLQPATRYTYTLRALGAFGQLAPDSNGVDATTADFAPALQLTQATSQGITISLTPSSTSESFVYEGCRKVFGSSAPCSTISSAQIGPRTSGSLTFSDPLPITPGTVYTYQLRATDAQGNVSSLSKRVVVAAFSDDPLATIPVQTRIVKASHITELRSTITALRRGAGLPDPVWAEAIQSGTVIKAAQFTELRAQLGAALTALGQPVPVYHNPSLARGGVVQSADVQDIRQAMRYAE